MFICRQKINFILYVFLEMLRRRCSCDFGYFGMGWLRTRKVILSTCRKLSGLSAGKNSTSFPTFLWSYCKDMQISYFGYFEYAWLRTPKMITSTSMFICIPKINFLIHFFFQILHFKESCNLIDQQHLALNSRSRLLPDMG